MEWEGARWCFWFRRPDQSTHMELDGRLVVALDAYGMHCVIEHPLYWTPWTVPTVFKNTTMGTGGAGAHRTGLS